MPTLSRFIKIPGTLRWKPHLIFTTVSGGAVVLAYKLVLILPFAQLTTLAVQALFGAEAPETPAEADRP